MDAFKRLTELSDRVLGINRRNLEFIYPNNPREAYALADDKWLTKQRLHTRNIPTPDTYAVIETMGELEARWEQTARYPELVIKPANGSGGGGILLLTKDTAGIWRNISGKCIKPAVIRNHIANILFGVFSFGNTDKAIIESRVVQHSVFREIYPDGVADLRMINHRGILLMAMLRIPTIKSAGRANLHQGALGVGIDLDTGRMTDGFLKHRYYTVHPDTGVQFTGTAVPYWKKVKWISQQTYDAFPFQYLGIDIVIDQNLGPLVMEINLRPGLEIQNVNKKGLLHRVREKNGGEAGPDED